MAGHCKVRLLPLLIGFILRTTFAQDPCVASNEYAMYLQSDGIGGNAEGIYRAVAGFTTNTFTKQTVSTTENPTAISYDVVDDVLYWAGNDVTIGKYIKKSPLTGGTAQAKSLVSCTATDLGVADGTILGIQLAASSPTALAANTGPERGRLNLASGVNLAGTADNGKFGAWIPTTYQSNIATNPHWISVNFLGRPTITGIKLQGREDMEMWTTTYGVEYSQDYDTWDRVKDASGNDAVFMGNSDQSTVVTQTFHEPVVALYIRILPLSWEDRVNTVGTSDVPALRFEVVGCKVAQCLSGANLGVQTGTILDSQLSASSGTATLSRLDMAPGWQATGTTLGAPNGEYVQVLFGGRVTVTDLVIKSVMPGQTASYPTELNIQYWDDTASTAAWKSYTAPIATTLMTTNQERDIALTQVVSTTGLRIFPSVLSTGSDIAMTFEVKGCRDPEISRMTVVGGSCGSRKIYWVESGQGVGMKIHYADLDSSSPTEQTLLDISTLSPALPGTIVDVKLHNNLLYFARQSSATSSYIHSASLIGAIQQSREVHSTNGNIQSIAIDTANNRVYYSINPGNSEDGRIGYTDLALTTQMTVYEVAGSGTTFQPFDIGVFGDYVYVMQNKDSIRRLQKDLTTPTTLTATTNSPSTLIASLSTGGSLSSDLQFFQCVNYPEVKFETSTYSKFEHESIVDVKITRTGDLRCCSSVGLTLTGNGALETTDFSLAANTAVTGTTPRVVNFNDGTDSVQLQFTITADNNMEATIGEGDERFSATLNTNNLACAAVGTPSTADITIKDYESCYYFADPSTVTYTEGDVDTTQTIDIKRQGYLQRDGQIFVDYEDGTARRFTDYDITSNTVMFTAPSGSPQDQTVPASVTIKGDTVIENPVQESFKMKLLVPANTDFTSLCPNKLQEKTVTITDNDYNVYLQETNIEVLESAPTVNIPVCREGHTTAAVVVPYSVQDDSARQGQDYNDANTSPGQVTITSGQMCANIIINIVNDNVGEYFEAFSVSINQGTGNRQTYVQIKDDDITIRIEKDAYEITESSDLFVKLLREGVLTNDQDVSLVAVQGDARPGSDYVAFDQIEFKAGEQEQIAFIDIIDDTDDEQSESFTLRLINGAGEILSSATVTILDNDDPPPPPEAQLYSFDRPSISVDENAAERAFVDVTRTRVDQAGSVTVTTSSGTATSGTDFIPHTQTVVQFGRDVSRQSVIIEIINDLIDESDETFTLQLSNPSDGTVSGNTNVVVTIRDDDQDNDGGGDGDGGDGDSGLSTPALIGIIAGSAALALAIVGLLAWGALLLARPPPPPPPQFVGRPFNNRAFRPV